MIDLYFWPTPNGYKATIMLEEVGLAYSVKPIDITAGDQFARDFLAISPNNKIPAIVDLDGPGNRPISVFESGAILLYLAEKTERLIPSDPRARIEMMEWLMFQMGGFGPMLGQAHHFRVYAPEKIDYAFKRYTDEATRLYQVLNTRLDGRDYLAGDYSIADIATFTWVRPRKMQGQDLADYPNIQRWYDAVKTRPAVRAGLSVMSEAKKWEAKPGTEAWASMFGNSGKPARDGE
ncbi:glutathione S-transferase N-terminal domain-containing protein [Marinovum sp. SP66]|uniref:glutathione S-transferase N-terminal domain-containing protein n=1 Tax=Marinovum sp. SP66 TaxID=3028379 RepID=UPI00237BAE2C|nr:glutathione S-transferase N-terminal domain-containing protein [Marinovum sp. SP66]MDD9739807.1 glutathione S-transferase N-terminal domain-containing protein [Marinovum sp. SP66]